MTPTTRRLCIASLERMLTRKEVPEFALNSARARLAQLQREAATAPAAIAAPRKTSAPAVDRFATYSTFMELSKKRSALLHRWGRLSREDHGKLLNLIALLPDAAPATNDEKAWSDFAARVAGAKAEIN
jgi:hypothetical protein